MTELIKQCSNCKHFAGLPANVRAQNITIRGGVCRRYPPTLMMLGDGRSQNLTSQFPPVQDNLYCGDYESGMGPIQIQPLKIEEEKKS